MIIVAIEVISLLSFAAKDVMINAKIMKLFIVAFSALK